MENRKKNRKFLIVGVVVAVAILAALVGLLLTQCGGSAQTNTTGAPVESTAPAVPDYDIYWNLDRAEYDGKSEAGMSSRQMESDGYFHIRFLLDGEVVTLKTVERRLVNRIDATDMMGLELDQDGLIVGVLNLDDLPLEVVGYKFYVKSVGGKYIKINSAENMSGIEEMLECVENTRIYDMSGVAGPVGTVRSNRELTTYDRVICVRNLVGELTHVFVYERSNYMKLHKGECQHCQKTVEWGEWSKTDTLPTKTGHYQLQNDITLTGQQSMWSQDQKICLDLNGKTVEGAPNKRLYSLHNVGAEFALMDTSAEQTGKMVGHSTSSPQGGIVWARYGAFYMYGGTLDGSDMISKLNGTVVQVTRDAYFYMYGGTIIGGTAEPQYDRQNEKYNYGLGGSVQVTGTMRMYGGTIIGGKAPAVYYYKDGKLAVARGMGGNLFLSSGSVFEMTGGQISFGYAGNVGANIMMDGMVDFTMSGGTISGGWTDCQIAGKHGASIYCPAKATITMSGGTIEGGLNTTAGGANLYLLGTMTMTDGHIVGGNAKASGGNIQMGGNAKLYLYGGFIRDGVSGNGGGNINMSSKASIYMYGGVISGGTAAVNGGNLCGASAGSFNMYGGIVSGGVCNGGAPGNGGGNISVIANGFVVNISGGTVSGGRSNGLVDEMGTLTGGDGGNININRGTVNLTGGIVTGGEAMGNGGGVYVGWNSVGLNLKEKAQVCGNTGTDVCISGNTAAGKSQLVLGAWDGNGSNGALVVDRVNAKAGTVLAVPAEKVTLTEEDAKKFASCKPLLPVVLSAEGKLILSPVVDLGEADHVHCLCNGGLSHTCADTGFVSVTAAQFAQCWNANGSNYDLAGSLNLCLSEDITLSTEYRLVGNTLNLCLNGHTITMEGNGRITANGTTGVLNITDCGEGKIQAAENCRASLLYTYGGKLNIYAGTVDASLCKAGNGGAINAGRGADEFTLYAGTILGSKTAAKGGAIYATGDQTKVNIHGGLISGGKATDLGGNICMNDGVLTMTGGIVTGGEAAKGGSGICVEYKADGFYLSGTAVICGNADYDVRLNSAPANRMILGAWSGNPEGVALTFVKMDGEAKPNAGALAVAFGTELTEEQKQAAMTQFASGASDYELVQTPEGIVLALPQPPQEPEVNHSHCVCNGTLSDTEGHVCADIRFTEVDGAGFLALFDSNGKLSNSVAVVLTADVELATDYYTDGKTLTLCLNGHTVTMKDNGRLNINGNGELNLTDCGTGGNITAEKDCRSSLLYTSGGKLNIYAGTVDASLCKSGNGGAVYLGGADQVHIYGGTLIGSKKGIQGGTVYAIGSGAKLYVHGGTITGGVANKTKETGDGLGGNIHMAKGELILTGGTVTGGSANGKANENALAGLTGGIYIPYNGTMTLSGDARIYGNTGSDIYLTSRTDKDVFKLGAWSGNGDNGPLVICKLNASVGTQLIAPASGSLTDADLAKFSSGVSGTGLELNANGGISLKQVHYHCLCNGALADKDYHVCNVLSFVPVDGAGFLALFGEDRKLDTSSCVVLTENIELAEEYWLDGKTLDLCLGGHTITMKDNGRLTSNGTTGVLNITDCSATGSITALAGCRACILYTYNGGINLYEGTLDVKDMVSTVDNYTSYGGAVHVDRASDSFTMYGGTILGGQTVRGGAVYVQAGSFTMYDGTISGGRATRGGNVGLNSGSFAMHGGVIVGGSATLSGAGVNVGYSVTTPVTLSGNARIYGNTGMSDIHLGQNAKNGVNYIILDNWTGYAEQTAMVLSSVNETADTQILVAKDGTTLSEDILAKLAYLGDTFGLKMSDDATKILLTE